MSLKYEPASEPLQVGDRLLEVGSVSVEDNAMLARTLNPTP